MVAVVIRPSRSSDSDALQTIERSAGARFREVGLTNVADDEPLDAETLAAYATDDRSWVAVDHDDQPIGYILVDVVDGNAHVEQVSVLPDCQGAGIGRALLDRARERAVEIGAHSLTLTTFSDVAWNRPLYEHLGFVVINEPDIGPELAALRAVEAEQGLDPTRRVCMRLALVR